MAVAANPPTQYMGAPTGIYSCYDCLTDNPYSDGRSLFYGQQDETNNIWVEKEDQERFGWHQVCRVVRGDGHVTPTGRCVNSAEVDTGGIHFSVDGIERGDRVEKGLPILDATFRILKNHPLYKKNFLGPNKKNLLKYLVCNYTCSREGRFPITCRNEAKLITTAPVSIYAGRQENRVYGCQGWAPGKSEEIHAKYRWAFVDPSLDTTDGQLNRKRIEQIVDSFMTKVDKTPEHKLAKITRWPRCHYLDEAFGAHPVGHGREVKIPARISMETQVHHPYEHGGMQQNEAAKEMRDSEDEEGEDGDSMMKRPAGALKRPAAAELGDSIMKKPARASRLK